MRKRNLLSLFVFIFVVLLMASAQNTAPDLKQPTLYVVPYAHLDTQWRWDYVTTINEYLPSTLHDNFALIEKYPHYVFSFSGANRYRLMKEYYPADFARLKSYVDKGRWFPAGSSMEENDVNNPSAESILRQVLYGTSWFRRELGRTSAEYMLPDCFGFPASLPSILAHAGLKGFSTQKLTWRGAAQVGGPGSPQESPRGVPFNVGYWVGLDGHGVIAALNAEDYTSDVPYDLSKTPPPPVPPQSAFTDWPRRVETNGRNGLFTDYHYTGTGDVGGAPREWSIRIMQAIVTQGEAPLPVPGSRTGEGAPVPAFQPPVRLVEPLGKSSFTRSMSDCFCWHCCSGTMRAHRHAISVTEIMAPRPPGYNPSPMSAGHVM